MRYLSKCDWQREEVTMDTHLEFWLVCYKEKKKECIKGVLWIKEIVNPKMLFPYRKIKGTTRLKNVKSCTEICSCCPPVYFL